MHVLRCQKSCYSCVSKLSNYTQTTFQTFILLLQTKFSSSSTLGCGWTVQRYHLPVWRPWLKSPQQKELATYLMPEGEGPLQVSNLYLCINTVPHLICGPCVQGLPQYVSSQITLFGSIKDLGVICIFFHGIEATQSSSALILTQTMYVLSILCWMNMLDCKPYSVPVALVLHLMVNNWMIPLTSWCALASHFHI